MPFGLTVKDVLELAGGFLVVAGALWGWARFAVRTALKPELDMLASLKDGLDREREARERLEAEVAEHSRALAELPALAATLESVAESMRNLVRQQGEMTERITDIATEVGKVRGTQDAILRLTTERR